MSESVEISLIGAKTYGTMTRVYQQGEPTVVTSAVWEFLRKEVNPADGALLFCLTADLPAEVKTSNPDLSAADLRIAGIDSGEIDTGSGPVENTLDILKGDTSGSDPQGDPQGSVDGGTGTDLPPGEVSLADALAADGDVTETDPNAPSTDSVADASTDGQNAPTTGADGADAQTPAPSADAASTAPKKLVIGKKSNAGTVTV